MSFCCGRYAIIILSLAAASAADPKTANDLNDRGLQALSQGDYLAAEQLTRQALETWRALGPAYQPHYATSLLNLGEAVCGQGRWREAAGIYEEALAINRRTLGESHLHTVLNLDALANVLMQTGDVDRAAALFEEALAIEREHFPDSVQFSHSLLGVAMLAERAGRLDDALPSAEQSLTVALAAGGETVDSALAYIELAQIHRQAGRPERAVPLLRKALAIDQRLLGPEHPATAGVLSQEGLAYIDDHKLGLAEQDLLQAVGVLERCHGCYYPLAIAKNNLGLLRFRQKRYEQAAQLLTEALSLQEGSGRSPTADIANTLRLLADVRDQEHRPDEAAQLRRRALAVQSYR